MKRLSQSGSSNFCPELRKNSLLISQSHFSNFALHVIRELIALFLTNQIAGNTIDFKMNVIKGVIGCLLQMLSDLRYSGVASVDNWRGEYSYIA